MYVCVLWVEEPMGRLEGGRKQARRARGGDGRRSREERRKNRVAADGFRLAGSSVVTEGSVLYKQV